MGDLSEDRVHRIIEEHLHEYDLKTTAAFTKQEENNKESEKTLAAQSLQLERIEGRVIAIYGNGSGRKCILDRLEDKQNATDVQLAEEIQRQSAFRHEVRNQFQTLQLLESSKLKAQADDIVKQRSKKTWIKWVSTGLCIVLWELFKIFVLKVKS